MKRSKKIRIYGANNREQRWARKEREIAIEFLRLINENDSVHELIRAAVTFYQRESGCQAVGVRLKDGDDYPYFEARGCPQEFLLLENSLCSREDAGHIYRDQTGNAIYDCICGNVICGRFDPSLPFFTERGSFWTNSTTELRALASDNNRWALARNRCNSQGYESVALLPLHVGEQRLGLLQLNDPHKGVFSLDMIGMWERLADQLAVALAKFRAEEKLLENRADLKRAQAVAQIGSWRLDVRRNELRWSDETYRIFGLPQNTPLNYETFLSLIHPDDRDEVNRAWQAALRGDPYDIVHRIYVNEKVRWVREKAELEFDAQGTLLGGFGTTQDITEATKKEIEHLQLNRTLKALRDSSQAISCAVEEKDFLDAICRIVAEDCGHQLVWIGFAEDNDRKTVRPAAFAGFEQGYLETLHVTWADTERGRGPTGTAIRRGRPIACRNMLTDPRFKPWREEARKRGYASSLALPLMDGDRAFGALTIYSKDPDPFTDEEVRLLAELANDLAYGILAIRLRIAHEQAEKYLLKSEERYRSLVELSPDAVFVNRDDRIEYVNPACLKLFGATSADQLLGKPALELFHPDGHDLIRPRIEQLRAGHGPSRLEEKILRLDGKIRDVEVAASYFTDQQGPAVQVILHDITERKRAEEQLRLHLTILESTANAIVIAGRDGLIQWINPAFTRLTGYSPAEVLGKSPRLLKSDFHDRKFFKNVWDTILAGRVWQGELVNRHKDGSFYTEEMTITPVADAKGQITHFIAVKQDVTQRKLMEDHLRTAKEAAEAANVAKDHFIANISHELRTPMNAILGMTELALSEDLPPMVRNFLATAKDSADILLELLNEILDFSRMQAAQFQLETAPFSLRRILAHTLKILGVQAYDKGLELLCDLPDEVPDKLIGDSLRLRQVLTNLIGNAIKFTAQGQVLLTVETLRIGRKITCGAGVSPARAAGTAAPQNTEVIFRSILNAEDNGNPTSVARGEMAHWQDNEVLLKFSVEDSGIGIPPQEQERIFAPFTQADASMTRSYGGTGLGLAIASQLVGLMGGRIAVESQVGKGSAFSFTARFERQLQSAQEFEAENALNGRLHGLPILLVSVQPAVRRLLHNILLRWGMQPETIDNVPAALVKLHEAALAEHTYPVVIVDHSLAQHDVFTLASWTKNNPELASAPILLFSPCNQADYIRRCEELGVRYLEKPLFPSHLRTLIAQSLGLSDAPTPASSASLPKTEPLTAAEPKRILVVEDNLANQQLANYILCKFGHSPEIAGNGLEAIECVRRENFDLVLMDIQMPLMDGFQATAAIRALPDPRKAALPIVAMTAHAMKGDRQRCLEAGMDDYLNKPIKAPKLFEIIERLTNRPPKDADPAERSRRRKEQDPQISPPFIQPNRENRLSTATASSEVFNLEDALAKCYDRVMFDQMREYFFTQSTEVVRQIRQGLECGEAEEIANAAHALKGTLVYLGANACLDIAKNIEQLGRKCDLGGVESTLDELIRQIDLLKESLLLVKC